MCYSSYTAASFQELQFPFIKEWYFLSIYGYVSSWNKCVSVLNRIIAAVSYSYTIVRDTDIEN